MKLMCLPKKKIQFFFCFTFKTFVPSTVSFVFLLFAILLDNSYYSKFILKICIIHNNNRHEFANIDMYLYMYIVHIRFSCERRFREATDLFSFFFWSFISKSKFMSNYDLAQLLKPYYRYSEKPWKQPICLGYKTIK